MLVLDNPKELSRKKIFVRIFDLTLALQTLALLCSFLWVVIGSLSTLLTPTFRVSPGLGSIPDTMPYVGGIYWLSSLYLRGFSLSSVVSALISTLNKITQFRLVKSITINPKLYSVGVPIKCPCKRRVSGKFERQQKMADSRFVILKGLFVPNKGLFTKFVMFNHA